VCGGDGKSCLDCCGIPFGRSLDDQCGVCDGFDECLDCEGVPFGSAEFDRCGVCNGCNACLDCEDDELDVCLVCHGDGTSCLDCDGVPFGTAAIDVCGVCGGDGTSCFDCAGVLLNSVIPGALNVFDECDVCGGQADSCLDCAGVPNGPSVVDACGVCGGEGACLDCAGVPNGLGCYDECDVCNGDGTSCIDCAGVRFGTSERDACGVCNGNHTQNCDEVALANSIGDIEGDSTVLVYSIVVGLSLCVLGVVGVYLCYFFGFARFVPDRARRRDVPNRRRVPDVNQPPARGAPAGSSLIRTLFLLALVTCASANTPFTTGAQVELCQQGLLDGDACSLRICEALDNRFLCGEQDTPRRVVLSGSKTQLVSHSVLESIAPTVRVLHLFNVTVDLRPETFKRMRHLRSLVIDECHLTHPGFFDQTLECNTKLEVVQLTRSHVWLVIDERLHELQQLRTLRVRENKDVTLGGVDFCFLAQLEIVDLRNNHVRPNFPLCFPSATKCIHLDGNGFSLDLDETALPLDVDFNTIEKLTLANNHISGDPGNLFPPPADVDFPVLFEFRVGKNKLTGEFPDALCKAMQLMTLDVSYNQLNGILPSCLLNIGPLKTALFDNNQIEQPLPNFTEDNLCGQCTFFDNLICEIPASMGGLGCEFSLLADGCDGGCGDTSCFDCLGHKDGFATYDACDVCGGDNSTCRDCRGIINGPSRYDACDVCEGDGSACTDCAGVPNGAAIYDRCDVCDGDGSACADCEGVPYGTAVYDACDVCGGNNARCRDCRGVVNGPARFDECGVCEGDGLSCAPKLKQDIVRAQRQDAPQRWILLQISILAGMCIFCGVSFCCLYMVSVRSRRRLRERR